MTQEQGLKQYFDAQMRLLMQAGKQFAQLYPEHASLLNLDSVKDRDPHIERLLEGVAYLTANIQKRLDETLPEISSQVLRQLCPILLDYYPSTTVVQFQPALAMQQPECIKKQYEITTDSSVINGECIFTTSVETELLPLAIDDVEYHESHLGSTLTLSLKKIVQAPLSEFDLNAIRFYLCGDTSLQSSLLKLMTQTSEPISLITPFELEQVSTPQTLSCKSALLDADSANLPNAGRCHPAYSLLLDYFNGKERFYFVELTGLDVELLPIDCDKFKLQFVSNTKLPPGHRVSHEQIRLNCAPAINLFEMEAEPIQCNFKKTEYQITAKQLLRDSVFSHSVLSVHGRSSISGETIKIPSRYETVLDHNTKTYSVLSKDLGGYVASHFIQLPVTDNADELVLSTRVLASNAVLPRQQLFEGDLNKIKQKRAAINGVKNVILPTKMSQAPAQSEHWQLIGLLNLKFSEITDVQQLQRMLVLFDWSGRSENINRIKGLQNITVSPISIMKQGMFLRGVEVKLQIDESRFACLADVYHFGSILHQFFVLYAPINECVKTSVCCFPSLTEFDWDINLPERSQS
ncbi:type VI secretion system baseplate subunit TssF [Pseudoalteromonas phenolica]|uniref:type VI secretion system baseplate subunit TssF n=1 Tax=Pseudoalteromonas phenolica TaxID=161398 RepID=UPI00110B9068|nr:type VI secretion system baseplate subunit TssF [Pseudoalteromonas phenolica]TMO56953.1 type VI secretion system baseplate subunit TssF [Pseudoalteromonas phenolica]